MCRRPAGIILIPSTKYNMLRLSPEFIGNDHLGKTSLVKGQVGEFMNCRVVKIPDSYVADNVNFMIVLNKSFTAPWKLNDTKIHKDPPGYSGDLLEGRFMWDAFVLGAKADGIYVSGASGSKQAAPTITISSNSATVASTGADKILYTLDGTDPDIPTARRCTRPPLRWQRARRSGRLPIRPAA